MTHTKETIIYRLLIWLLSPVLLLWLLREAWQQKSWAWLGARLGGTTQIQADVWLHCASVGEVNAAAPLVQALHEQGKKLLLTTFTPTGQQQARHRFAHLSQLQIRVLPLDWVWTVNRFLKHITCPQLWLVETEFWPTLMTRAKQQGIRINLINARITHKTLNAPLWWRRLLVQQLDHNINHILCRNEQDALDFRQLGIIGKHLRVAGNLKWCDTLPDTLPRLYPQPYVVFASTHAPEELELAQRWVKHPQLPTLVIVPRHPKRGNDIAQQLAQANIPFRQRSLHPNQQERIILADSFGELQSWMAHSELVIMGGSFAPKGGQNPLEAIRLGKLVLCGPDMRDFAQEVFIFSELACLHMVPDYDALIARMATIIPTLDEHQTHIIQGQQWLQAQQADILARYVALIDDATA